MSVLSTSLFFCNSDHFSRHNRCLKGEAVDTNPEADIGNRQSHCETGNTSKTDISTLESGINDNSECTPKDDNKVTGSTTAPGDVDFEESQIDKQPLESQDEQDDSECNTTRDLAEEDHTEEHEGENGQNLNTRLSKGRCGPKTQSTAEDNPQTLTTAPSDRPPPPPQSSLEEEQLSTKADLRQDQGDAHSAERSPDTSERSMKDTRLRDLVKQEPMSSEKYECETRPNEDSTPFRASIARPQKSVEDNVGCGVNVEDAKSSSISKKVRLLWEQKRLMRQRGKTTEARPREVLRRTQLRTTLSKDPPTPPGHSKLRPQQLSNSSLVYPLTTNTNTQTSSSACLMPSFYATWSGYRVRACGVKQAVWPLAVSPRAPCSSPLLTTTTTPRGSIISTAANANANANSNANANATPPPAAAAACPECSEREGVLPPPAQPLLCGALEPVPKTKTTKTYVWGQRGPREVKSVRDLQAHNSRWKKSK